MASALAIVEVLQGKPPLICLDEVGDCHPKKLRAMPIINSNVFQAVGTLNNDWVLGDDEVKANVVLELCHVLFQHLAFATQLAHLDQMICAADIFLKKLGKRRILAVTILRDNSVSNRSVNFIWKDKPWDQKLGS